VIRTFEIKGPEVVAEEYEPATVHEKKMPINIGQSAFPA